MHILPLFVGPDLETPFLKEMHGRVHVTGDVINQVFPGDTHQVLTNIADIVLAGVLTIPDTHILVDC